MYIKYPRTPHLPWSPGATGDDVRVIDTSHFNGFRVVVTEKLDGENTSMYRDHIHARSINSRHHPSRTWVKQLHAAIASDIPIGWRLCGENLYARHSIAYENLAGYFYLFSIWNEHNECLPWDIMLEWSALLDLPTPAVIFDGVWDEELISRIKVDEEQVEGYVMRLSGGFKYEAFSRSVAKWVRPNHVQTDAHWMYQAVIPNGMISRLTN